MMFGNAAMALELALRSKRLTLALGCGISAMVTGDGSFDFGPNTVWPLSPMRQGPGVVLVVVICFAFSLLV